jgi:hypothetical protein
MYVGISVIKVQKPQFWPQWATRIAQTGHDVRILAHGVGKGWKSLVILDLSAQESYLFVFTVP